MLTVDILSQNGGKINIRFVYFGIIVGDASHGNDAPSPRRNRGQESSRQIVGRDEIYLKNVVISKRTFVPWNIICSRVEDEIVHGKLRKLFGGTICLTESLGNLLSSSCLRAFDLLMLLSIRIRSAPSAARYSQSALPRPPVEPLTATVFPEREEVFFFIHTEFFIV